MDLQIAALKKHDLLYLGTPYGQHPLGHEEAFIQAATLAAVLVKKGISIFCPITHTHPIEMYGDFPSDFRWVEYDIHIMKKCDGMVVGMLDSWEESRGLADEMAFFRSKLRPIYYLDPRSLGLNFGVQLDDDVGDRAVIRA